MVLEYIAKEKDNNISAKDIVKKRLNVSSRLYTKISKDIYINDKKCYSSDIVKTGDRIIVDLDNAYDDKEKLYSKFNRWEHEIDIIYEDEYVLCINKEKGVPCHPSYRHQEMTLYNAVINYYIKKNKIIPIHFVNRLDKDTTGVVLIAKHKYIQEILSKQLQHGSFTKKYVAAVYGKLDTQEGIIEKRIKRKENSIILREVTENEDGEYAKTGYRVLKYNEEKNYTILEIVLYTGRTHQIRVHFASIGHPLLGDELYVKETNINVHQYIDRQALHASEITFYGIDGKEKIVRADMPNDINYLLNIDKFT